MKILRADRPRVQSMGGGLSLTLASTLYQYEHSGATYQLTVPAKFVFDGASIPQMFWTLLGLVPHGDMDGPALAHDFIYHHMGEVPLLIRRDGEWAACEQPVTRSVADQMLGALCLHYGAAGRMRSWLVWAAVRLGGFMAWRRDDEERKKVLVIETILE
jgi:hypothetical protein